MVEITDVEEGSLAERLDIRAGDVLLAVNGNEIVDVLDYRFYLAEECVKLSLSRGGVPFEVTVRKGLYDDVGLSFETPLMDKKRRCANKCIFCFIDQLPKGLRPSLYFKDDDARLSFLHGNYVTLTNLFDKDIDRIIKMHISPINVSVHTTNPSLRCEMMGNRRAGDVLSYLKRLADAGIGICAQIVLCRGVNDGAELDRTLHDLVSLYPSLSSVSVVPSGLTDHREGLYPLTPFSPEECRRVIAEVNAFGDWCERTHGERIFYLADEFYVKAGMPLPSEAYYGGYPQLENGVGMLRLLREEFMDALSDLEVEKAAPRHVTLVTGKAASGLMRELADALMARAPFLSVTVRVVENRFFGKEITVSGLLTGKDVAEQLAGEELGDAVLLPENMLRAEGDLFLCGMTPEGLEERLGAPVLIVENSGEAMLAALLGT